MTMTMTTDYGLCEGYNVTCDAPATGRFKGEEDSFGIEWVHLCDNCFDAMISEQVRYDQERDAQVKNRPCWKCKKVTGDVRMWHIPDEPTYESDVAWCRACRDKCRQDLDEEMCGYDQNHARRKGTEHKCYCGQGHDLEARKVCQAPTSIWPLHHGKHYTEWEARLILWNVQFQTGPQDEMEYVMCEMCAEKFVDRMYA